MEKSSTAVITYNGTTYTLPMNDCEFKGLFSLDENWRELDYKNGDSSISLMASGVILPIPEAYATLPNVFGVSEDEMSEAVISFEIDISHTAMDAPVSFVLKPLDVLPLFPTLADIENYSANKAVCADSGFWFGAMAVLAVITDIKIYGVGPTRTVSITGYAEDTTGRADFVLMLVDQPFSIVVKIAGYSDEFVGTTIEQRKKEIIECFGTVYDIAHYTQLVEAASDEDTYTRIRFIPKS